MSLNKVMLIGRLGRDAEFKTTQSGSELLSFSMATSEKYTDRDGEKKEKTEWHDCVLWGKRASTLSEYLTKGTQLFVEGSMETQKWKDKDGKDHRRTVIKVGEVKFIGGNGNGQRRERDDDAEERAAFSERAGLDKPRRQFRTQAEQPAAKPFEADPDDIPF